MTELVPEALEAPSPSAEEGARRPMTREEKAAYRERKARRAAREAARQSPPIDTSSQSFQSVYEQSNELFRDKRWEDLSRFGENAIFRNRSLKRFLVIAGRGALYHGAVTKGVQILEAAHALYPEDKEIAFYRGVGHLKSQEYEAALTLFRRLMVEEWNPKRVRGEMAPALAMKLRDEPQNEAVLEELLDATREIVRTPNATVTPDIAMVLQRYGHGEDAVALLDKLISERPDHRRTLESKAKILIEQSRIAEAVALSHDILARWPDNPIAQFNIRVLGAIASDAAQRPATFANLGPVEGRLRLTPLAGDGDGVDLAETPEAQREALEGFDGDWIVVTRSDADHGRTADQLHRAVRGMEGIGYIPLAKAVDLWRRDAIADLLESGLCGGLSDPWNDLAPFRRFYGQSPSRAPDDRGVAVIMSKHGSVKFGGGEHFIASMADHYASMGYRPLILGCRPELIGESGQAGGHDYIHIENSPAAMRALFLDRDVSLVHSLSSIGYEAAQALRLTNIPFIYGIHFWSDALGGGLDKAYFDAEGAPIPRPEFSYIVARAQTVYTNSAFTQRVIEQAHGMRCPVIFSVPEEAGA